MTHRTERRRQRALILAAAVILCFSAATASAEELTHDQRTLMVEELLDQEPRATEVRDRALRYYELHPDELTDLRQSLRTKAGAPYFVVSERYQNNSLDRTIAVDSNAGVRLHSTDDDVGIHRSATTGVLSWNLPTAVMTDSEFQSYQLAQVQRLIINTVNSWYYSRRMLLLELLVEPPTSARALTSLRLRIEGFTALLDVYTGGWFSQQLPELPPALRPDSTRAGGDQGTQRRRPQQQQPQEEEE